MTRFYTITRYLLACLLIGSALTAQAQIIRYVSINGPNANPATATSWATSTTNLQGAINSLSVTGGQVWVTGGTYKPGGNANTNRAVSFSMRPNVAIYGGFVGVETLLSQRVVALTGINSSTLSGDIGTVGNTADNSYHVISNPTGLTTTAVLDGFVIAGGNANGSSFPDNSGGGIYNNGTGSGNQCSPLIRNCIFQSNTAGAGGVLYNNGSSSGNSSPVFINCAFQRNTANAGGALFNYGEAGNSRPLLVNCSFQSNSAALYGGAILGNGLASGNASLTLVNCSFQNNTAPQGGALFNDGNVGPVLTNCVLWNNGGSNTFFYVNTPPSATATYSLFEPSVTGYTSVTGNLTVTVSPFASAAGTILATNSPAINAGDPATTISRVGTTDLVGSPRFSGGRIDMGAYEVCLPVARFYVNNRATGANSGLSWADAFIDLQSALTYPCLQSMTGTPATEIWVATGVYKPTTTTDRTVSFVMRNGVALYGDFVGNETAVDQRVRRNLVTDQPRTVLSGDIGTASNTADNSFHVISNPADPTTGTPTPALLDGVVITAGNANGSSFPDNAGGGMLNQRSSPTVQNCVFINNVAVLGGAIYNNGSSSGRDSSPTISYCVFQTNTATSSGGAMYNNGTGSGNSSPTLVNCAFLRNAASGGSGNGGAVYTDGSSSGNSNPGFTNCSFQGNTATNGGALYSNNSSPALTNCVLFGNGGVGNGGVGTFFTTLPTTTTLRYSLIEPAVTGYFSGPGNLNTTISPFVSTVSVALTGSTLALNNGDPASTTATVGSTDLAGNARFAGCRVDMGAVEAPASAAPSRLYVSASQTAPNGGDGLSWATAYKDLQSALTGCGPTEIWVAAGTYRPTGTGTDRAISFAMRPNTAIYGGFVGNETLLSQRPAINPVSGNPPSTTLSGDIGAVGNTTDNSYHVISNPAGLTTTAVLDGFLITGGNGDETGIYGGGIFNNGEGSGNGCSPTIRNCVFAANRADIGGAICNYGIDGGNSSPTISNCLFQGNTGTRRGGAIFNYAERGTSSPTLANCAFLNNTGGALRNDGFSGGVSSPRLTNCSFQGNTNGFSPGGAIYSSVGSSVALTNCVLFGNGGANNNVAGTFFNESGATITMRYSLAEPAVTGYVGGPGNLNTITSPFATTASVTLTGSALAFNNGDPATTSATVGTTDLAGNVRFAGCRVDMGAVEDPASTVPSPIYVAASQTALNGGDGLSWATAYKDLQSALTGCGTAEIWVAAGTYRPTIGTDRAISFAMRPGTAIYGGFLGTETSLSQRPAITLTTPSGTTLSGDIGTIGSNTDNSFHVINNLVGLSETSVLDGFVVTGGNANGGSPDNTGGGMYNNGAGSGNASSPGIRNCLFVGNRATFGGAIFNGGFQLGISSPAITNTVFQSNTALNGGGAVYNAGYGSGNSSPTFVNCAFLRNGATNGGSLYNDASGGTTNPAFINCSFQGNTATNGGNIYNFANFSSNSNNPTLTNCVLFGNGGTSTFFNESPATTTLRYSLTEPAVTGYVSGPGNLTATASPFVSATSVVLSATALAINTGDPATTTATVGVTDVAGNPRFGYGRIDMGAYEVPCGVVAITRLYVQAGATGANTGLTWADAFTDLQAALNYSCGQSPGEIWVASGVYKPGTSRNNSFAMRNGLAIIGGFAGSETTLNQRVLTNPGIGSPTSSILSGDIGTVGNITDNSYHVISNPPGLTTTAILDGFIITGGNANDTGFPNSAGGGMYNNGSGRGNVCNPTLRNCSFQNNTAFDGGAMYNNGFLNMGTSSPVLTNCSFINNTATDNGGAIYNNGPDGTSSPMLTNCSFQNNTATNGGAMYSFGTIGNSNPALTNCSFLNNTASSNGGAMYNFGDSGNSNPVLTNCVLFGNGGSNTFFNSNASITTRYSFFESSITGYTTGPGNLTTATTSPFASPATTRLRVGSPAINTGDPATTTATVGSTDLAGLPRFVAGRIDMGAVEVQDELFTIAPGNWNNPAIWNAGRIPQLGDRARLKHAVTIPASYVGFVTTLVYDPASKLIYQLGGRLQMGQ